MTHKVVVLSVPGAPDGRSYVHLEQSVRRPPKKFRSHHLLAAYAAGFMTAVGVALAMLVS